MSIKQTVPPAETLERNLDELPLLEPDAVGGYEVCSWRDGPAHSAVPCTEVHVLLNVATDHVVGVRLKSPAELEHLVNRLLGLRPQLVPGMMARIRLPIEGGEVMLRLKSRRALDELVGVLRQYRLEVWGKERREG